MGGMRWAVGLAVALAWGCDAGGGGPDDAGPGGGGSPENTAEACQNGVDDDGDGDLDCDDSDCDPFVFCVRGDIDAGPPTDSGPNECVGISAEAENALAPVDIIWVVDSSDSMRNDAETVQTNLDGFATAIAGSGVDYHVVFVSDRSFVTPSPLFTSNPAQFRFIDRGVSSGSVFARALDQHPAYADFLRPNAITHVIGISDDDDDQSASAFVPMMEALVGPFTFHAIAAEEEAFGIACTRNFIPAADIGERYFDAATATGGLQFSICTDDWSGLFNTLAMTVSVSEMLPCVFDIPEPPMGMTFDRDEVNVEHTPEGMAPMTFPRVPDGMGCSGRAWYYDDPTTPSQILLCPMACDAVTGGPGRVDIRLGCATLFI